MVNSKRKQSFSAVSLLLLLFVLNVMLVNGEALRIFDEADLFSQTEIAELDDMAYALLNMYDMDVVVVTTNDTNGKSTENFADDYFDDNGFGAGDNLDGVLFLLDMDNRGAYIATSGSGVLYFTDQRIENLLARISDSGLGEGDYFRATREFLNGAEDYLASGIPSNRTSNEKNSLTFIEGILSFLVGIAAAVIFFFMTKSRYKMKSATKVLAFRENSVVNMSIQEDNLIDTVLTHRIIPKPTSNDSSTKSSTHTSSNGTTHGGGGTSF